MPTQERSSNIEQGEKEPKIQVTFCGIDHGAFNLEVIPRLKDELLKHIEQSSGRTVIFRESANATASFNERVRKNVKRHGGIGVLAVVSNFIERHGRIPWDDEVDRLIEQTRSLDVDSVVASGLVPTKELHSTYKDLLLDEISEGHELVLEYETHSPRIAREVERLTATSDAIQTGCINQWVRGKFDGIVEGWKEYCVLDQRIRKIRDEENVDYLKKRVGRLIKEKNGSLFIMMGGMHSNIVVDLARKLGPNKSVLFNSEDYSRGRLLAEMLRSLGRGEGVSEEQYAGEFFNRVLCQRISDYAVRERKLGLYTSKHETINSSMELVAGTFSMEDIEEVCKSRVDLISLIKSHPGAASVRDMLLMDQ